ncbi:competence protein ComEA [Nitrosospira sp. Nsp5]|uniref:Competence protein ComEA n=2 Tax=Nitrosospira TaxID=35798 RepID=A0A1W6SRH7_9PROT|nr:MULTISPECIES: ComEA family DNA-binding protein [Nitrosospira]ARO88386.1 competence protein ComEA [Nitrosospira lacus]PTR05113.1 competence protein ComEA [Nitrosospira sp. Nsp5]SCY60946.1 competence protein ComEA [Nitrosospira sp. Nsp13]SDQ63338.1 competence protein ComEA [Nitrosospira multiformis]
MKKLLITLVTMLAFTGAAHAVVNINTATQAELQTLPGISSARAKAIIEYRTKAGAFRATDDLIKVDDTIDMRDLRKDVTITGPTLIRPVAK